MKKKTLAFALVIIVFPMCISIISCKKNDHTTNPIIGKWTLTAYIHDSMDVYGTGILPCLTDDIFTFTTDKKIIRDEGLTKCDAGDPQTVTGSYSLNGDNTQLNTVLDGNAEVFKILILNSTTLKTEQADNSDIATYKKVQ